MSDTIYLDKKGGVNPALSRCCVCGNENNEIALIGNGVKYECRCGRITIAPPQKRVREKCEKCGESLREAKNLGAFDGTKDKVLGGPCTRCEDLLKKTNINVCPSCGTMSTADAHRVVKAFEMGVDAQSLEEAIEAGYVVKEVGHVARMSCDGECPPKEIGK